MFLFFTYFTVTVLSIPTFYVFLKRDRFGAQIVYFFSPLGALAWALGIWVQFFLGDIVKTGSFNFLKSSTAFLSFVYVVHLAIISFLSVCHINKWLAPLRLVAVARSTVFARFFSRTTCTIKFVKRVLHRSISYQYIIGQLQTSLMHNLYIDHYRPFSFCIPPVIVLSYWLFRFYRDCFDTDSYNNLYGPWKLQVIV